MAMFENHDDEIEAVGFSPTYVTPLAAGQRTLGEADAGALDVACRMQLAATGGMDGKLCLWDLNTNRIRHTLQHEVWAGRRSGGHGHTGGPDQSSGGFRNAGGRHAHDLARNRAGRLQRVGGRDHSRLGRPERRVPADLPRPHERHPRHGHLPVRRRWPPHAPPWPRAHASGIGRAWRGRHGGRSDGRTILSCADDGVRVFRL